MFSFLSKNPLGILSSVTVKSLRNSQLFKRWNSIRKYTDRDTYQIMNKTKPEQPKGKNGNGVLLYDNSSIKITLIRSVAFAQATTFVVFAELLYTARQKNIFEKDETEDTNSSLRSKTIQRLGERITIGKFTPLILLFVGAAVTYFGSYYCNHLVRRIYLSESRKTLILETPSLVKSGRIFRTPVGTAKLTKESNIQIEGHKGHFLMVNGGTILNHGLFQRTIPVLLHEQL